MYMYMLLDIYIYIYIHTRISLSLSLSLSLYRYMYIYIYVCVYIYIYIYIHAYRSHHGAVGVPRGAEGGRVKVRSDKSEGVFVSRHLVCPGDVPDPLVPCQTHYMAMFSSTVVKNAANSISRP